MGIYENSDSAGTYMIIIIFSAVHMFIFQLEKSEYERGQPSITDSVELIIA